MLSQIKSLSILIYLFLFSLPIISGCALFEKKGDRASRNPCIILALPDSGPHAAVATKIKKGADIAKNNLLASEIDVRIEYVNTELPTWITTINNLPESCAVVGGPLQEKAYLQAEKSGILEKRAFFSFMPALKTTEEGKHAWRFFPSPQDQIDALVKFVTEYLNILSFGAFYPNDAYGSKMTALLEKSLSAKQIPLEKTSYNHKDPASWTKSAAVLIKPILINNKNPLPNTAFEALFLPESWKNVDKITGALRANGEDRLIIMGTTLWEQSLYDKNIPNAQNYALAIFPGAYSNIIEHKALQKNNNDFWTALGFDFINFAINLGLQKRLSSPQIIAAAQRSASSIRAIAPIYYDNNGIAHEKLFIFQVSSSGIKPINLEEFRSVHKRAKENAAIRFQKLQEQPDENFTDENLVFSETPSQNAPAPASYETIPETEEKDPQSISRIARPITPQSSMPAPLGTTPKPSYKLRLPVKR